MADKEETHWFSPDPEDGKGIQLKLEQDPANPAHSKRMNELFKEVSESNPETIQEFLISLNEIDKVSLSIKK